MSILLVTTIDGDFHLEQGEEFTFGRSRACTFCVDDTDRNLSRQAGSISYVGGTWVLVNTSDARPLVIYDTGRMISRELASLQRHELDAGRFVVSLNGTGHARFEFDVVVRSHDEVSEPMRTNTPRDGAPTLGPPPLVPRQRMDVAALAWEWHQPPGRRAPRPLTYEQASQMLGCTAKSLERRMSDLRASLARRGYPRLDDLAMLCSFLVVATRAVKAEDFDSLGEYQDGS